MERETYPKEEMDLMLAAVHNKVDNNHREVMVELKQHRMTSNELLKEVQYTNGKVKKIIIALTALGAFAIGTGLENIETLIALFI